MDITPKEKLREFFKTSKPNFYKKKEIVLRIGDAHSGAFFIEKGYIKDSTVSIDGREFTFFIFRPLDLFSYNWIFNEVPNEHSFKAMSDCLVYEKSREGLLVFLDQNPDVQFMITQNLVTRMRGLMQRMEHLAFGNATQKVSSILYILSERFGKTSEKGIYVPISLTQQDVAELIGLSRETTSTEIKKLTDMNIISCTSGHYIIQKPKLLAKFSQLIL